MLTNVLASMGGFLIGYVYASLIESYVHEHVNDAKRERVQAWKKYPWLLAPLIRTNFSHHGIHHCRTYRKDHMTQFQSTAEKAALDAELSRFSHGRQIIKALYGNKFSFWGWIAFCAPLVPGLLISYPLFGPYAAGGVFAAVALPPFMSNYVHQYLHLPYEKACTEAPWPLSLFIRTPYYRAVTRYHFLHHRYGNKNFNLVLGGDWLRGKYRKAHERDLSAMQRLGIRLD